MKKILSCMLAVLIICTALTVYTKAEKTADLSAGNEKTASRELEDLFTTLDLMDATISELQAEMEAGNVTSERLTEMYIERIEAYDEKLKLNSILFVNPEALDDARALDQERNEGKLRGPLHGIPLVVKANCEVAGMAVTAGSISLAGVIASEDSFVVKRLKEAGAVILALTNMSEFAYSSVISRSTLGGNVHNAYDTDKIPGGSSGGTAVAVTSNFAAAGVGTDTGGSIRNPSSFNNIYGIKPSKGLTSISGVIPLKAYRDTTGPMARTAEDLALLLEIMAGTDEADDYTLEADADALLGSGYTESLSPDALQGVRIGYLKSSFDYMVQEDDEMLFGMADQKVDVMCDKTIANLSKAGATFVDLSEVLTDDMLKEFSDAVTIDTFAYDVSKYLYDKGDASPYQTIKELRNDGLCIMNMNMGFLVPGVDELPDSFEEMEDPYTETFGDYQRIPAWQSVLDGRELVTRILEENDIDAIMYLNFFDVPIKEEAIVTARYNRIEYDITLGSKLGLPDISIPMGFSDVTEESPAELPLGLSLTAGYGQDGLLLRIAYAYEQQAGDIIRRTPEATPALEDPTLNAFLLDLIDRAYSIDYSQFEKIPEGKVRIMQYACEKALTVDKKDPSAVYEAAGELAEAYDNVMACLGE